MQRCVVINNSSLRNESGSCCYAYQSSSDDSRALPLNAQYRSIPQKAFLRSSLVLPSPAKLDTKGKYSFDEEALKAIKSELYKGHGVSLAINVSHNGFIQDNMASYYDGNNAADHTAMLTIPLLPAGFWKREKTGTPLRATTK